MRKVPLKKLLSLSLVLILLVGGVVATFGHSSKANTVTVEGEEIDLKPWLAADINWQQFEGKSISVLALPHAYTLALEPYVDLFEELTGIRVAYELQGETSMRRKRTIDWAGGTGLYDVNAIGLHHIGEASEGDYLADINEFVDNPDLTDKDWYNIQDVGKSFRDVLTKKGKLLALPIGPSAPIFWYRKDLFEKYDIEVPDTWEDIIPMKKKLQTALKEDGMKNISAFTTRAQRGAGRNTWTTVPIVKAYGGRVLTEDLEPVFNSPEAVEAIKVYRDCITGPGTPKGSQSLGFYEIVDMFASGQLASMIAGVDHIVFINDPERSSVADKWAADLIPRGPETRGTSPWAWSLGVNASSKKKQAAWLFVQWASSEPTMKLLGTAVSPSRISIWDSKAFQDLGQPGWIKAAKWSWDNAKVDTFRSGLPQFPEIGEAVSVAFSDIFSGAPVEERLNEAVKDVEEIVD